MISRAPALQTFLVSRREGPCVRLSAGTVEGSDLLDAAQNAATMLFDRAEARPCVVGSSKGEFIAFGRVVWMRYEKREIVREIRFTIERKRT
jgi:hypothetical protein